MSADKNVCTYRYVDPDGDVHTCHHKATCPVCQQCSKLVNDRETGHCTGHLGLADDIWVPGKPQRSEKRKGKQE